MPAPLCFFRFLAPDQAEWLRPDGEIQRGALAELASQAGSVRLMLVAPGEAVTLHRIPLPGRKRTLWTRAVPYALEDQLIDDIEALHFALGQTPDGDGLPVATVDHHVLRGWLETCAQAGLMPVAVIPDLLLLPWQEGDWSVLPDGQRIVVRIGRWAGFVTEPETLDWFLNQALVEAGDAKPQWLRIYGSPPPVTLDIEWQVENEPSGLLQCFAAGYRAETVLNLLQGPYSRQTPWKRWLRPWRATAILAGVWLSVQGVGLVYEHGRLQQEQIALRAAIEQVYKDAVPGSTRIVNPRVQLETRLRELTPVGASGGAFLELLYQGGQPLANFPDITLRGLSYREGQLDLALEGGNPAVLDQLRQQLEQQPGIRAEIRTTQREGQMESKVTLKKATS
ncbi:MAG TPA: type II secretion system protein GspL [Candidatus Competibacteraceae bacterium]|nr:type II secretion system protein GspL [Candidatus Competibacteraceae bacterium]HRZ04936.1 type II secretion system protein GspL [Candidatus Competibacteraceae bacterium]HSA45352.1 type II secretion system protein GspL [Candidatus Competibacteraceae bacterium]